MHHKITHAMVGVVAVALLIVTAAFAFVAVSTRTEGASAAAVIPPIGHPVGAEMDNCQKCHVAGQGQMPASHFTYKAGTCQSCHKLGAPGVLRQQLPPLPHPVAGAYANCVACHATGGKLNMPDNHNGFATSLCLNCHSGPGGEQAVAPLVPHPTAGAYAYCSSCHAAGTPRSLPQSHAAYTDATCLRCHSVSDGA